MTMLAAVLAVAGLQAQTIPLYLEPDRSTRVYHKATAEELQALNPVAHASDASMANEGWYWVEYPGMYLGYVKTEALTKQLTVMPGSYVFLKPANDAPLMTRLTEDNTTEVVELNANWVTIYYNGTAPVYFQTGSVATATSPTSATAMSSVDSRAATPSTASFAQPSVVETPSVVEAPSAVDAPKPATVETFAPAVAETEPIYVTEVTPIDESPAQTPAAIETFDISTLPMAETMPLETETPRAASQPQGAAEPVYVEDAIPVEAPVASLPAEPKSVPPAPEVSRTFIGTLESISAFDRFIGRDYELELVDAKGKRIGFVDLDNAIRLHGLHHYLDQQVILRGAITRVDGGLLITCHSINRVRN